MPPKDILPLLEEPLFRFTVVSNVLSLERMGQERSRAIKDVAGPHRTPSGTMRDVKPRTLYRWLAEYEKRGIDGLMSKKRAPNASSLVLSPSLLTYFKQEKTDDPLASIPELIKRARLIELEGADEANRVTVWRALNRMAVDTSHHKSVRQRDMRRFAYPHRMNMLLCDGKHFRVGEKRLRRVALFFLDDATRMGLEVVVGTSETAELFLRGLYGAILNHGQPDRIYFDRGPGFIAHDVIQVAATLAILVLHGEARYPQARGKIEKFMRTVLAGAIRYFDGNPHIDPDCRALELRLRHYLFEVYNHSSHESLNKETPWNRFHQDPRQLRFMDDTARLRAAFVIHEKRRVTFDNTISFDGTVYEVPQGHAGASITVHRNTLDGTLAILHLERLVKLAPVDVHANARARRAKPSKEEKDPKRPLSKGSVQMAFDQAYGPIVDADGNCLLQDKED